MARCFRRRNWNVVLNGVNADRLKAAAEALTQTEGSGGVACFRASVVSSKEIHALAEYAAEQFGTIDIWINNAGVNQPMKAFWELTDQEIDSLLDIDLRGTIIGSCTAVRLMEKQPEGGYIYNIEGYGSNDAMMLGLNMYGTCKRAVTHFTAALAKELAERGSKVKAGRLAPGIMITDFISNALGGEQRIELPEKTKKVYNILGDRPETVAEFLVEKMISNTANNAHINWLTGKKAAWRFMTAAFSKRDFFGSGAK
ncbi:MAG: SDR family oxidoreductase [Oscillospiraceae bacterium]|nr:SDR family oxidoreductase [Oscillospiraceae bacterium]